MVKTLQFGDADVTIWGGVNGVGPLALLWCQGSLGVPSQYIIVFSLSVGFVCLAIHCHSAPLPLAV
jgi:hypothetical protein